MSRQDEITTSVKFATRLRQLRAESRLNQREFAELGGVTLNSQNRYEAGKNEPTASYFLGLAANGLDVAFLFSGRRTADSLDDRAACALTLFLELRDDLQDAIISHLRALRDATAISKPARDRRGGASDRVPQASGTLHSPKQDYRGKN